MRDRRKARKRKRKRTERRERIIHNGEKERGERKRKK